MPSIEFTFGDIQIFVERLNNEVLEKFPFEERSDFGVWYEEVGSKCVEEEDPKLSGANGELQRKRNDSFKTLLNNWIKYHKDTHDLVLFDFFFI